jgi:hypothetical protein
MDSEGNVQAVDENKESHLRECNDASLVTLLLTFKGTCNWGPFPSCTNLRTSNPPPQTSLLACQTFFFGVGGEGPAVHSELDCMCFHCITNSCFLHGPMTLEDKAPCSFRTSWTIYPVRQCHNQGRFIHKGYGAAARPEILRKIKLNIWIKVSVQRYGHPLKEYECNNFKFKYFRWTRLSAAGKEWAVTYPDVAGWDSTAMARGRKRVAGRSQSCLQPWGFTGQFSTSVYLFLMFQTLEFW